MAAAKTKTKTQATAKKAVKPAPAKQAPGRKKANATGAAAKKPRIYAIPFASVYPLYVQKVEKKGRTQDEVDQVIAWLTGYKGARLERALETRVDFEVFFAQAPRMNPNADRITGVVCGVRVEDISDPLMQKIRYLDKLVDELAQGKPLARIFRE